MGCTLEVLSACGTENGRSRLRFTAPLQSRYKPCPLRIVAVEQIPIGIGMCVCVSRR